MTLVAEHPNPIAVLDAVIADMRASGDTGHIEDLLQTRTDISNLRIAMVQVMGLWDSNCMSIDGKAASMQNLPEKWRDALAPFGDAT